jgi:hypothetical protein
MVRILSFFLLVVALAAVSGAQAPASASDPAVAAPAVVFTLDFPGSQPEHYSIRVPDDGKAHYESSGKLTADSDETDHFSYDFTASADLRQKVFDLARRAKYFQRDLDSHNKNLAFTGKKVLSYKDAQRSGESGYNYSSDASVQELTTLFQNLSATLEFGHRLDYYHHYQKLALEEELKRMDDVTRSTPMVEVQAIAPILSQIVGDASVINVSRARAQRMLDRVSPR